jgi:LacI family transcriptional regulator
LVAAGARTVLFVGDPGATADVTERFTAIAAAAERDGASVSVEPVLDFSEEAGVHAARQALARRRTRKSLPDAFACANDELALGLMIGLRDAGLRVPEDAIVSGWDDVMAARYAGLTTVRQPMRDLGARAAQLLDELIHRSRESPVHEVLPTELIVRQSTTRTNQLGTTPPAGGTTR